MSRLGSIFVLCALSAFCSLAQAGSETLRLRSGHISGPEDNAGLNEDLRQSVKQLDDGGPALIKFHSVPDPETRAALRALGIRLAGYVGNASYIGFAEPGARQRGSELPDISWIAPFHPGLRISPTLASIHPGDERTRIPVTVQVFPHLDAGIVANRMRTLGIDVHGVTSGKEPRPGRALRPGRIVGLLTPEQIVELREVIARWPETLWIDRRPNYRLSNDDGAWVGQSGLGGGEATPIHDAGLHGEGQVIGVLDTGIDVDMCFFWDPVSGLPPTQQGLGVGSPDPLQRKVRIVDFLWSGDNPTNTDEWDDNGHGTHVAGSVAGDDLSTPGIRDSDDGMAPAAQLVIQDGGYAPDNCSDLPGIGCPAADLYPFFEQAYLQGARIHSNSYGDRENLSPTNLYSDGSEAADAIMWDYPDYLLLFAAGNLGSGSETVGSPATAKNVVAVGATDHGNSSDDLASFSSRGPAMDGRFKPDIVIQGRNVVSANSNGNITNFNCNAQTISGTSMSCPTAAGFAALARQYFTDGFYPTGAATPGDALPPSGALLKATLIASATPLENESTPPPNNDQGWGRLLLDDVLYFSGDANRLFVSDVAGGFTSAAQPTDTYFLDVDDDQVPLRVVLTWTDYPSNSAAVTNLVNNLDLEVESPSGTVYRGNVFSNGLSITGGSADALNTVEAFRLQSPQIGLWEVRVVPIAVPQPSQGYALVATGAVSEAAVSLQRTDLAIDDSIGGNGNGSAEPGEWIDLPLTLFNNGGVPAENIQAEVDSTHPLLVVVEPSASLPDLMPSQSGATTAPHLRVRLRTSLPCPASVPLDLSYTATGHASSDSFILPVIAACEVHNPAPLPVVDLSVGDDGTDIMLGWNRPALDPDHGETATYRVYRSISPSGGFALIGTTSSQQKKVSLVDPGGMSGPSFYYEIIPSNASGDAAGDGNVLP